MASKFNPFPTGGDVVRQMLGQERDWVWIVLGNEDAYDASTGDIRLTYATYSSCSIRARVIAAHEAAHALQHRERYLPFQLLSRGGTALRGAPILFTVAYLASLFASQPLARSLTWWCLLLACAAHLIVLPVEWNASSRALQFLRASGWHPLELRIARAYFAGAFTTYIVGLYPVLAALIALYLLRP